MKENSYSDMDEKASRVGYLIAGFIRQTLTEKEHDELDDWVNENDHNMQLFEDLTDEKNLQANLDWMDKVRTEQTLQSTKEKIQFIPEQKTKIKSYKWIYTAAASVILLIAGFWIYKISVKEKSELPEVSKVIKTDIQPGGNNAILTLSDGSTVDLNKAQNGLLKNDNGASINKSADGEIAYTDSNSSNKNAVSYNILSTPNGGQYKVQLPDGSMVWLNAASSLKYPTNFVGTERDVVLKGEAYFEIKKDINKPFKVTLADESEVKVLGTHFNVMAYENEKAKEVTLLEGSVQITKDNKVLKLKPGQQGQIDLDKIKLTSSVDTEEVTGWKNGEFVFHDADIESIMRQVERWYDVKIKYQANVTQHFNATLSRNEPVSRLLHILEETDQIHFKIENKIIYVLP